MHPSLMEMARWRNVTSAETITTKRSRWSVRRVRRARSTASSAPSMHLLRHAPIAIARSSGTASRREAHSIVARTVPRRVAFLASTIACRVVSFHSAWTFTATHDFERARRSRIRMAPSLSNQLPRRNQPQPACYIASNLTRAAPWGPRAATLGLGPPANRAPDRPGSGREDQRAIAASGIWSPRSSLSLVALSSVDSLRFTRHRS